MPRQSTQRGHREDKISGIHSSISIVHSWNELHTWGIKIRTKSIIRFNYEMLFTLYIYMGLNEDFNSVWRRASLCPGWHVRIRKRWIKSLIREIKARQGIYANEIWRRVGLSSLSTCLERPSSSNALTNNQYLNAYLLNEWQIWILFTRHLRILCLTYCFTQMFGNRYDCWRFRLVIFLVLVFYNFININ